MLQHESLVWVASVCLSYAEGHSRDGYVLLLSENVYGATHRVANFLTNKHGTNLQINKSDVEAATGEARAISRAKLPSTITPASSFLHSKAGRVSKQFLSVKRTDHIPNAHATFDTM